MKKCIFSIGVLFVLALFPMTLYSDEYVNGTIEVLSQPDGSKVKVKIYGDSFYQRVESIDGYTLIVNKKGWICYALLNRYKTKLIATREIYRGAKRKTSRSLMGTKKSLDVRLSAKQRHMRRAYDDKMGKRPRSLSLKSRSLKKLQGMVVGLTILIDFPDSKAKLSKEDVERFLNQDKGKTYYKKYGSIRHYFKTVSVGKLNYVNIVKGFYRAKYPKSHYNKTASMSGAASQLIEEALNGLKKEGFDFSYLSHEKGYVTAVNVLYAGSPNIAWARGLWPHRGWYRKYFMANGVRVGSYQITAMRGSLKGAFRTFCHENGHLLAGWPDLYDYDHDSHGVGSFCLMALGEVPNAYFRHKKGWGKPIDITNAAIGTTYKIKIDDRSQYFIYRNKGNRNEAFYIEAMSIYNRYNGLVIWHVDKYGNNRYQQMTPSRHYMVSVKQADGKYQLEKKKYGNPKDDMFSPGQTFSDRTTPHAKWWNGRTSGIKIYVVSNDGDYIIIRIGEK